MPVETYVLGEEVGPSFQRVDWYAYDSAGRSRLVQRTDAPGSGRGTYS